jgi:glycosyltransferase involved in cell wall biosynthesis
MQADCRVSVIIPVFNGEEQLRHCLTALEQSDWPRHEVIVVADGCTDGSRAVAERHGAGVLTVEERSGPARARNIGARHASGDVLFFLDADVVAAPDAVRRVAMWFADGNAVDAVIGSYDDSPAALNFLSQYRNLMHCFVHQTGRTEASTFWSGCGAIRRDVFLEHNGFDESYARPAIEDIELGYRLSRSGRRLRLDNALRAKHLKRWTLCNLLKTDVLDRAIPWTELILRERNMPDDLNLQLGQRASVMLAFLCVGSALLAALAMVLLTVAAIVLLNRRFFRFLAARRGWWFAVAAIPMHVLYYFYSGLAFGAGVLRFAWRTVQRRQDVATQDDAPESTTV